MPDVWTRHPDIVRDLLREAGFTCGVEGRFLQERDPEWTCIFDGTTMRGDLYIHHVGQLRSDVEAPAPAAAQADFGYWAAPALAVLLGLAVVRRRRRRGDASPRDDGLRQ